MRVTNTTSWILSLAAIALAGCATGHDGDINIGGGQSPDPVVLDIPVAYVRGPLPGKRIGDHSIDPNGAHVQQRRGDAVEGDGRVPERRGKQAGAIVAGRDRRRAQVLSQNGHDRARRNEVSLGERAGGRADDLRRRRDRADRVRRRDVVAATEVTSWNDE